MTTDLPRRAATLFAAAILALTALAGGCSSYAPRGIPAMSTVDICEIEYMQGRNLSAQTKQTIQSELQRRKDNCGNHAPEVAQRFADFMWVETYGRQSP